jgi:hypothetical protein
MEKIATWPPKPDSTTAKYKRSNTKLGSIDSSEITQVYTKFLIADIKGGLTISLPTSKPKHPNSTITKPIYQEFTNTAFMESTPWIEKRTSKIDMRTPWREQMGEHCVACYKVAGGRTFYFLLPTGDNTCLYLHTGSVSYFHCNMESLRQV